MSVTHADTLAGKINALVDQRETYDAISIADIRTASREITAKVIERRFAEYGERFLEFRFPDGSTAVYSDDDQNGGN